MSDAAARQADRSLEPPPLNHMLRRMQPIQRSRPGDPEWADVACDQASVIELLAHLGDEEAAEIVGVRVDRGGGAGDPLGNLPGLFAGVWRLASKLPPKRVAVACAWGCAPGTTYPAGVSCSCSGEGYRPNDTPAERWLLVVAAEAVARECLQEWLAPGPICRDCADEDGTCPSTGRPCDLGPTEEALDACRAWIAEPTPERERVWANEALGPPEWVPWPYRPHPDPIATVMQAKPEWALLAAADVLGPDRVREIASRAIMGAVRGFKEAIE